MLFSIVETRKQGRHRPRQEILAEPPQAGRLIIEDWREGNSFGRALRVARFRHPNLDYYPELLLPLTDPSLVQMTASGFLLVGYQLAVAEGVETIVYGQGWWVRAVAG